MTTKIRIYAGGVIKNSPFEKGCDTYLKRIHLWSPDLIECSDKKIESLKPQKKEYWIALCERGKTLTSSTFAHTLQEWTQSVMLPVFLIGASHGLPGTLIDAASFRLSLGAMTWPHLLARLLLLEQIYRAQQRILNHPYSFT